MSSNTDRLESAALLAALLLVAAFVVSFVLGVARDREPEAAIVATPERQVAAPQAARGRVEVLNASGRSGLARAATLQLRDAGFDVVFFGTANERRDSSIVLDRVGRPEIAKATGAALDIAATRSDPDSTLLLDATVLLGLDWQKRQVVQRAQQKGWRATLKRWLGRGD